MKAREIMTSDPSVVTPDEPIARAAEIMRDLSVGAVPVVDDKAGMHLAGIITDRDVAIRCVALHHEGACRIGDHMTPTPLATIAPDEDAEAVVTMMERAQIRRIPVAAHDGKLLGIIAQADVATKLGPAMPERVEEMLQGLSTAHVATV